MGLVVIRKLARKTSCPEGIFLEYWRKEARWKCLLSGLGGSREIILACPTH